MECPESIEELEEIERMLPLCPITVFRQAKSRKDAGAADSWKEAERQISDETGKPIETVRSARKRGQKKEGGALHPPNSQFRTSFTGENEWYTPKIYIDAAREVMGNIDLDPASSDVAQEIVQAGEYYTKEQDGLSKAWHGKVWLNPPYSQPLIAQFIEKCVEEYKGPFVDECIVLTNNYTDTAWFHLAESVCAAICFTKGRIRFEKADGERATPTQGSAFFYMGHHTPDFVHVFERFGFVR